MKKKREKVKGRARAIVCMILLIVLSIPLGAGLSLIRERDAVRDHYYILIEDLADCRDEAVNMTTLAGKYMEADVPAALAAAEVQAAARAASAAVVHAEEAQAEDEHMVSF